MKDGFYNREGLDWLCDVQESRAAKWARRKIIELERKLNDNQALRGEETEGNLPEIDMKNWIRAFWFVWRSSTRISCGERLSLWLILLFLLVLQIKWVLQ